MHGLPAMTRTGWRLHCSPGPKTQFAELLYHKGGIKLWTKCFSTRCGTWIVHINAWAARKCLKRGTISQHLTTKSAEISFSSACVNLEIGWGTKFRTHSSGIPELMALRHIPKLGAVPPGWSLKFHCDGRTLPKMRSDAISISDEDSASLIFLWSSTSSWHILTPAFGNPHGPCAGPLLREHREWWGVCQHNA